MSTEPTVKIQCPSCEVSYRVDVSRISKKGVSARCRQCQIRLVLLRVPRSEQGKDSVFDLALFAPEIGNTFVRIYTKDSRKLFAHLKSLEEARERLLECSSSLIDTKLALEESVSDLLKSKARARMLEEELRRIRKLSWWQRLLRL